MEYKDCGCPIIRNVEWEGKEFDWQGKTFFAEPVRYFFTVPMDVEQKMQEAAEIIEKRGYMVEEPLMILVKEGPFAGTIYVAILPPEAQDPQVVTFPQSKFTATVVERKEPKIGPLLKAFRTKLKAMGKRVKGLYLWHVTCPTCSRVEGYKTVVFAET